MSRGTADKMLDPSGSGQEVRMHDRETVELALLALEEGWSAQGLVELRRRGLSAPATNPLWSPTSPSFGCPAGPASAAPRRSWTASTVDGRWDGSRSTSTEERWTTPRRMTRKRPQSPETEHLQKTSPFSRRFSANAPLQQNDARRTGGLRARTLGDKNRDFQNRHMRGAHTKRGRARRPDPEASSLSVRYSVTMTSRSL